MGRKKTRTEPEPPKGKRFLPKPPKHSKPFPGDRITGGAVIPVPDITTRSVKIRASSRAEAEANLRDLLGAGVVTIEAITPEGTFFYRVRYVGKSLGYEAH